MNEKSNRPDRREFARTLTTLAARSAALLGCGPTAAIADEPKVSLPDALAELVRSRFGDVLTAEQQKRLVGSLMRQRLRGDSLNRPALENGDDPSVAFRADL